MTKLLTQFDHSQVGQILFKSLGEDAQSKKWNEVLEMAPIKSTEGDSLFLSFGQEAKMYGKALQQEQSLGRQKEAKIKAKNDREAKIQHLQE